MKNMCHHIFSVLWDNRTNADVSSVVAIFPGKIFLGKILQKKKNQQRCDDDNNADHQMHFSSY